MTSNNIHRPSTYTTQYTRHLPTVCEHYHRAGSQSVTRLFAFRISEFDAFIYTFSFLHGVKSLVSLPTHHLSAFRCGAAKTRRWTGTRIQRKKSVGLILVSVLESWVMHPMPHGLPLLSPQMSELQSLGPGNRGAM
jgi:hypothetical protein